MNAKPKRELRESEKSFGRRVVTAVFIVLFTLLCYVLARSMESHDFSGGGRNNVQSQQH